MFDTKLLVNMSVYTKTRKKNHFSLHFIFFQFPKHNLETFVSFILDRIPFI